MLHVLTHQLTTCAPRIPAPGVATVSVPSSTKPPCVVKPVAVALCVVLAGTSSPELIVPEDVADDIPLPLPVVVAILPIVPVQAAPRGQQATCPAASALHLALGEQHSPGAPMFEQLL